MLAEALPAWAFGIETLKNAFQLLFGYAGALVFHHHFHHGAGMARGDLHRAMRWAEGKRIAQKIAEHLHNAPFDTAHHKRPGLGFQQYHRVIIIARRAVQFRKCGQDRRDIHGHRDGARQFRIHAR